MFDFFNFKIEPRKKNQVYHDLVKTICICVCYVPEHGLVLLVLLELGGVPRAPQLGYQGGPNLKIGHTPQ